MIGRKSRETVNRLIFIGLILIIIGSMAGCIKKEDGESVVVYTPARGDLPTNWAKAFTEKTDIMVEQVILGTNEVYGKILSERENPHADVWIKGGGLIPFLSGQKENLFRPYKPKDWEDMPEKKGKVLLRDKDWNWAGAMLLGLGYAYNPSVLSEDEIPKTWDELAESQWKDEIEMWDPAMSGTATLFLLSTLQRLGEEQGWVYLKRFYENLQSYTRTGAAAFKVARKEVKIAIHFQYQVIQYQNQLKDQGMEDVHKNLKFYMPPNSPVVIDPIAQIAGAPHPKSGEKFADFILSSDGQELLRQNGLVPIKALFVDDSEVYKPVGAEYSGKDFLDRALDLDFEWMGDNMKDVINQWKEEVEKATD